MKTRLSATDIFSVGTLRFVLDSLACEGIRVSTRDASDRPQRPCGHRGIHPRGYDIGNSNRTLLGYGSQCTAEVGVHVMVCDDAALIHDVDWQDHAFSPLRPERFNVGTRRSRPPQLEHSNRSDIALSLASPS